MQQNGFIVTSIGKIEPKIERNPLMRRLASIFVLLSPRDNYALKGRYSH